MPAFSPLLIFADAGWLKLVFVVVFFLIWMFNNLVGEQAKARKAKAAPRPGQPRPPQVPAGERPPAQQQLVGEIEEFLKRANRKRQEKQDKLKRKPVVKAERAAPPPIKKPPRRLVESPLDVPPISDGTVVTVAESVREHLDTSDFITRASQLVDADIAKDDAERAAHMQEVFGHQVGRLADTSAGKAAATAAGAPQAVAVSPLAALLANPQSLKQAIILQEVLNRREF